MKCPHCGQEHPDNFQFCPVTGQKLISQLKACTNKQCPDFGKYILPLESKFCPSCGQQLEDTKSKVNDVMTFSVDGVSFNMILVEHGSFMMGAMVEHEEPCEDETPVHKVSITKNYYMGETQVTQALWTAIMGNNPSRFKGHDRPVESIKWGECQKFVKNLNNRLRFNLDGKQFRLPTEAEWEFAARGGIRSKGYLYAGSNNIDEVAWYYGNSGGETHPVAKLKSNELGLYDMSGNVKEWCQDWYGRYQENAQTNPMGLAYGEYHVFRGGGEGYEPEMCRLSCRSGGTIDLTLFCLGFRLALSD